MSSDDFTLLKDKSQHIKENVLFRQVKLKAKTKDEEFKGVSITRYYVQSVEFVSDEVTEQCDETVDTVK